jgi:sRNA-binding regulator protein Hfq
VGTILRSLVGRRVAVFSVAGVKDEGVVQNTDEQCVVLQKGDENLIFIVHNIRLIKVIE